MRRINFHDILVTKVLCDRGSQYIVTYEFVRSNAHWSNTLKIKSGIEDFFSMLDLDIDVNKIKGPTNRNLISTPIKCKLISQVISQATRDGNIEHDLVKVISNLSFSKNFIIENQYCCDKTRMNTYLSSIVQKEILQEISNYNTKIHDLFAELEIFRNLLP